MNARAVVCLALLLTACAGKTTPPASDPPPADGDGLPAADPHDSDESLTATECAQQGGTVVGDIGNGAIFEPGYVCPDSGAPPLGPIAAEGDEPIAVEGSVCCK